MEFLERLELLRKTKKALRRVLFPICKKGDFYLFCHYNCLGEYTTTATSTDPVGGFTRVIV